MARSSGASVSLALEHIFNSSDSEEVYSGKRYTSTTGSLVSVLLHNTLMLVATVCLVNRFHQSDQVEHHVALPGIVLTKCQRREE